MLLWSFSVILYFTGGLTRAHICTETMTSREVCCNSRNMLHFGTLEILMSSSSLNSRSIDANYREEVNATVVRNGASSIQFSCIITTTTGVFCSIFRKNITVESNNIVKVVCVYDPSGGSHCNDGNNCSTSGSLKLRSLIQEIIQSMSQYYYSSTSIPSYTPINTMTITKDDRENRGLGISSTVAITGGTVGGIIAILLVILIALKISSMIQKRKTHNSVIDRGRPVHDEIIENIVYRKSRQHEDPLYASIQSIEEHNLDMVNNEAYNKRQHQDTVSEGYSSIPPVYENQAISQCQDVKLAEYDDINPIITPLFDEASMEENECTASAEAKEKEVVTQKLVLQQPTQEEASAPTELDREQQEVTIEFQKTLPENEEECVTVEDNEEDIELHQPEKML